MKLNPVLLEAKRLHALGFAIHWLHPKSKRPVETGWTQGPRKPWEEIKTSYQEGYNLGVRLGTPSPVGSLGYLTVLDLDIKSRRQSHQVEAFEKVSELIGSAQCPVVVSGRGNGSSHYYCLTKSPFKTWNPAVSRDLVKVHMPSKKPSKKELLELTKDEIEKGIRIAPAWEISLYSDGRQVVLPPSIHPDSGKTYRWGSPLTSPDQIPLCDFDSFKTEKEESPPRAASAKEEKSEPKENKEKFTFEESPIDLNWIHLSDRIRNGILSGEGVIDRSGFLLPASTALLSAGLSQNEILTVLTDPKTFLGACAYDHVKSGSRSKAALWVWKYTLKRVMEERDAAFAFSQAAEITPLPPLSDEKADLQAGELLGKKNWQDDLEKNQQGKFKNTHSNCLLILQNVCEIPGVVGRNEFAANDYYLCDTPWTSKKGNAVTDIDIVRIKFYCAEFFGVEFGDNIINQALIKIADKNRYHPVRDWILSLKWDGKPRIESWLKDYAGAVGPEAYLKEVSRKVLVAMVKRVFEPGCKFDHVLILEGIQGVGKSTLLRNLAGDAWFSDATLAIGDKDAVLTMQSKWLIELGELSVLRRSEIELLKAFITQSTDRIRAPYGKRVEEFPRQCVFIGSTNNDEYLPDLTGNRRFWPIKVHDVDFNRILEVREQLFGEALQYYRLGEPIYLEDPNIIEEAVGEQAKRSQSDEWISTVHEIIFADGFPIQEFEIKDVAKKMDQFGAHKLSKSDELRIARCLSLLDCTRWRESAGARRRLWKWVKKGQNDTKKDEKLPKLNEVLEKTDKWGRKMGKRALHTETARKNGITEWREKTRQIGTDHTPSNPHWTKNHQ